MKQPHDIILKPIITEESAMATAEGKYTFKVAPTATKTEIRQACEKLFEVKVLKVNTSRVDGKAKRMGMTTGRTSSWKKAIVTIDLDPQNETFMTEGGKKTQSTRKYKTSIEEFGFGI